MNELSSGTVYDTDEIIFVIPYLHYIYFLSAQNKRFFFCVKSSLNITITAESPNISGVVHQVKLREVFFWSVIKTVIPVINGVKLHTKYLHDLNHFFFIFQEQI